MFWGHLEVGETLNNGHECHSILRPLMIFLNVFFPQNGTILKNKSAEEAGWLFGHSSLVELI